MHAADFLGVKIDEEANERAEPDVTISPEGASPKVVVLRAGEDLVAARAARELLSS